MALRLLFFVISLGIAPRGLAQTDLDWKDTIDADRPDMSNSAEALRPGIFQWESGINGVSDSATGQTAFSLPLALRFGIIENLELQMDTQGPLWTDPGMADETWSSLQDLGAGAKWTLYRREGKTLEAVGLLGSLSFQDQGSGPGLSQWNLALAFNFNLPADMDLGVNLGVNQDLANGNQDSRTYAGSLGFPLWGHWSGYLEGAGAFPDEGDTTFGIDGGLKWLLAPDVQLDGALGRFWTGPDAQTTATLGLSFRLGPRAKAGAEADGDVLRDQGAFRMAVGERP